MYQFIKEVMHCILYEYGKKSINPKLNYQALDKKLQKHFHEEGNKMIKNNLDILLQPKLALFILNQTNLNPEKKANSITKTERLEIIKILKKLITLNLVWFMKTRLIDIFQTVVLLI